MILLADLAAVPADDLKSWMLVAGGLGAGAIGIAAFVIQAIQAFRRKPPIESEFATKEELERVRKEFYKNFDKLDRVFLGLRREIRDDMAQITEAGEQRSVKLHDRINEILEAVSELKGAVNGHR